MNEVDKWFSEWSGQHESEVAAELPPDVLVRMRQQMFTEDIPVGDESDEQLLRWEQNKRERAERDRYVTVKAADYDTLAGRTFELEATAKRSQKDTVVIGVLCIVLVILASALMVSR